MKKENKKESKKIADSKAKKQSDKVKKQSEKIEKKSKELIITKQPKKEKKESKIKKAFRKFINVIKKRWLVKGFTTILLIAIILGIYVGINVLLDNVVLPELDTTENKVYSLSEETKTKVKALEKEVTITLINYTDTDTVTGFAEKYTALNSKVKLEKIDDLSSRKDIMDEYSLDATSQLIIIASGENKTTLSEYDLYTYDYSTYETIDTTEEAITNAIVEVTIEEKPKIYFMSNHVMYDVSTYYNTVIQSMEEDANEVETVDILKAGAVPEDCDTLVLTTLKEDITEFEKDKIIEYINRGGEILLLCGPDLEGKLFANFEEVLNQYGITIEDGVIFEGDSSNMLYGYPDFIIEELQSSSLTENLNMSLSICLADAGSIKFDEEKLEELGVTYEGLAYTSSSSFLRTNLNQTSATRTSQDSEESEYLVGAIATKTIDENSTSKLVIYSNELFATNRPIQLNGYTYYIVDLYNNKDAVLNSIAYLNEREDIITIRKTYDTVTYTATQMQHNVIMAIIFITPLVIIVLGIIVWQRRRRKR